MFKNNLRLTSALLLFWGGNAFTAHGQQVLTLKDAVQTALNNYSSIKAKSNYVNASRAAVTEANREYLPDLSVSFQQNYGTIKGQSGPMYGFRGLGVASAGPALPSQNWNASFGALYLANVNWDLFAFGRAKERIRIAQSVLSRDVNDLAQEQFQHQVRVAGTYLNLLAAQRIVRVQENNLNRALAIRNVVVTRAKNGLNAGVDSSLANAEVSAARISLTNAIDYEAVQSNQLAELMGVAPVNFVTDTVFVTRIPNRLLDSAATASQDHPLLKYYQSRVAVSNEQTKYFRTLSYPAFSLFSVFQGRGSGFRNNYGALDMKAYSPDYFNGVKASRSNYLVGVGMIWNLTSPLRIQQQVASQKFVSKALQNEYELTEQRLRDQMALSTTRMKNALENYHEAPTQVKAASDAYLQKSVLYKNGLSNIVDLTQALYALNRAESDRDIAFSNVWQALLLKAAASGDLGIFMNEF